MPGSPSKQTRHREQLQGAWQAERNILHTAVARWGACGTLGPKVPCAQRGPGPPDMAPAKLGSSRSIACSQAKGLLLKADLHVCFQPLTQIGKLAK